MGKDQFGKEGLGGDLHEAQSSLSSLQKYGTLVLRQLDESGRLPYHFSMPRHARLDAPGVLHHVIARGIEGTEIFRTEEDRKDFLVRVASLSQNEALRVYAWALMPNHFHLLVRTGRQPLARSMRKLLTSYVVNFNRRYKRYGHLFQNRYKSIICEDEPYLLELVRYIHLNPLRANLVSGLKELNRYPWTGHSALMGRAHRDWQDTGQVLARFARRRKDGTRLYEAFVRGGIAQGRRPDLVGGGLIRSAGGWSQVRALRRRGDPTAADPRILGSGEFVESLLAEAEEQARQTLRYRRSASNLESLAKKVAAREGFAQSELRAGGKVRKVARARKVFCQVAVKYLGYSGADVARFLGVTTSAVNRLAMSETVIAPEESW
jgi:putative transposase